MLMEKQQKLLEKASAKFKETHGASHQELGFNLIKFYQHSVLFAKTATDIENFKKSQANANKALTLTCIIAIAIIFCTIIYFEAGLADSQKSLFLIYIPLALGIPLILGNFYFFRRCEHYDNLSKNNTFYCRVD